MLPIPEPLDFSAFMLKRMAENSLSENDICRMAVYWAQGNHCFVTGVPLEKGYRELHHRRPRQYGGIDSPDNLVLLHEKVHKMIHTESMKELYRLLAEMPLTEQQLHALNILRFDANTKAIPTKESN